MSEPIEHCSELDEAEKGDGQLLVASCNATVTFDASEVVFDRVPVSIEVAVEAIDNSTVALWRDTDHCPACGKAKAEVIRIEGLVCNHPVSVQPVLERRACLEVMLLSWSEVRLKPPGRSKPSRQGVTERECMTRHIPGRTE